MAATIHDVAKQANVSVATVSRALAEPRLVRRSTLERVLAAAKALSYRPNPAARSLITGKTGNIGIIVPDLENPFYPSVLRGVHAHARKAGYAVLMADSEEDPQAEVTLVHTMTKQVDGVIICAPFASDAELVELASVTTLVLVNRHLPAISAVLMDTARGMRQAVAHLLALGHCRCAYLSGPRSAWSNRERQRGLHAAAESFAMEVVELGPFEPKFEGGVEGADLALDAGVTAILAFNDLMALGVLSRLRERGVEVPREISVLGFDNLLYASMCSPPLTTVSMPMDAAGRSAVDLLVSQLAGGSSPAWRPCHPELSTDLIVRGTTGPPFAHA